MSPCMSSGPPICVSTCDARARPHDLARRSTSMQGRNASIPPYVVARSLGGDTSVSQGPPDCSRCRPSQPDRHQSGGSRLWWNSGCRKTSQQITKLPGSGMQLLACWKEFMASVLNVWTSAGPAYTPPHAAMLQLVSDAYVFAAMTGVAQQPNLARSSSSNMYR